MHANLRLTPTSQKAMNFLNTRIQIHRHTHTDTHTQGGFMLHVFYKRMANKGIDWVTCAIMRTGSMFLTRRAKLDALSSALHWVMTQQNNQPLQITYESDHDHLSLVCDGDLIQLTRRLTKSGPMDPLVRIGSRKSSNTQAGAQKQVSHDRSVLTASDSKPVSNEP